jgi:hypothetical protein
VDHGEAFKSSCMAGGGRRVHDDGELHEEEDTAVKLGSPASVAGASSYKRALYDAGRMAVQTLGPNGDDVRWGWPALAMSKSDG